MKRLFFTMALCLAFVGFAQAQLSQGETYSTKIVTGNRPTMGDWGLYFGPSYAEIVDFVESAWTQGEKAYGLPLINLKYYLSDRLEMRMGLQYNGHKSTMNGNFTRDYDEIYSFEDEHFGTRTLMESEKSYTRRFRLSPGIVYHFSPKNVLDVYVGATIPFGTDTDGYLSESEDYLMLTSESGSHTLQKIDSKNNMTYSSFVIGVGGFIGLQAFVADLPVALGFEYGLTGMLRTNDKTYHVTTDSSGNTQSYYTTDGSSIHFDSVSTSSKYMGSDLRFTVTYFFNNK